MVKYEQNLNTAFAALADPTRRAIIIQLSQRDALVGELAKPFEMSLAAVSKHLTVLESAGLIKRQKNGRQIRCHLQPEAFNDAIQWIDFYRQFWNTRLQNLDSVLTPPEE